MSTDLITRALAKDGPAFRELTDLLKDRRVLTRGEVTLSTG
jgi:hypothetical protein